MIKKSTDKLSKILVVSAQRDIIHYFIDGIEKIRSGYPDPDYDDPDGRVFGRHPAARKLPATLLLFSDQNGDKARLTYSLHSEAFVTH